MDTVGERDDGTNWENNIDAYTLVVVQSPSRIHSLWPCGLHHARLPCPSPSPWACPSSCPKSVMSSNHLILCRLLLLLPSVLPSIRVFSSESALTIRWPKYWSFSFSISPSDEYSGLISLRTDWFDFLTVQGTLKSLLQQHNLKTSILVLSLLYGPTLTSVHDYWKNHSFDYMDLCWQSHVWFFICCLGWS